MVLPFVMTPSATVIIGGSAASLAAVGGYSMYARIKNHKVRQSEDAKDTIRQHVKHELRLGSQLPTIKKRLIQSGHQEDHVREVVGALELYHYVYHNLNQGHAAVKVKQALLHWGWSEAQVNKTLLHASNRLLAQKYSQKHITV
ncbi:MAG: hypothetical protein QF475_00375 [Candidatus Undinarchaeales archaeon]|nr:hypothetical protein [Candidatus Undinarchaeales archaeon]